MKSLLFLILLFACTKESITPCNYTLSERGETINIVIDSKEPFTDIYYWYGSEKLKLRVQSHYYDCVNISRTDRPMIFEVNGCKQRI